MTGPAEDPLDGCAAEPIRIPGAVQPHGWLLALTEPDLVVAVASANAAETLGTPVDDLLGQALDATPAAPLARALRSALAGGADLDAVNPVPVELAGASFDAVLHRADGLLLSELEPAGEPAATAPAGALGWYQQLRSALHRLPAADSVVELAGELTAVVRDLSGFDRVMVYRFTPEWDGEVIAEQRAPGLEPFLGLRYPAGDIPPQARALYTTNWLRLIPTSSYTPVALVPDRNPRDGGPLDLSGSTLRSVSPVHLEYLRSMGVVASMSVSLVCAGRLWGLIACHHYSGAHRPPYRVRAAAEMLGRTASILISEREGADRARDRAVRAELRSRVTSAVSASRGDLAESLASTNLLTLLDADGITVRLGGQAGAEGTDLPAQDADAIAAALLGEGPDRQVGATDSLVGLDPRWAGLAPAVTGALAVRVADTPDRYVLWTRPEWQREVAWAGDPRHQKTAPTPDGGVRISPRRSFSAWVETVGQRSRPWLAADLEEASDLGRELSDIVLRRVFERSEIAAALQRTLLAEGPPALPGLELAARYLPGGDQPVGGDWFDVLHLPDGRATMALGDVAGHGLMVSAVTAQLRQGLRAYLMREDSPDAALGRLNALAAWVLPDDLATALVAELDPATGALRWSSAGHLPPLVAAGTATRYLHGQRGPALGADPNAVFSPSQERLADGEVLLLYSDGLIERRSEPIDNSLERLRTAAAGLPPDPEALCAGLVERLGAVGRPDDVTLLAVRRATG